MATEGNKNAAFWERDDIEGARRAIDVWASWVHHHAAGCSGIPTLPWLDEMDAGSPFMRLVVADMEKEVRRLAGLKMSRKRWEMFIGSDKEFWNLFARGKAVREEVKIPGAIPENGQVTAVMLFGLSVEACLSEFGNPELLRGLLLHRYPRIGPYARTQDSYRRFRPDVFMAYAVAFLRGKRIEESLDRFLGTMEREFLAALSDNGVIRRIPGSVRKTKTSEGESAQVQEAGDSGESCEGGSNKGIGMSA